MMRGVIGRKWLRDLAVYVFPTAALILLAWWLGAIVGRHRNASVANRKRQELRSYLDTHIKPELSVGKVFPDVTLISPDGENAYQFRGLLRNGGLVVYLSGDCPVCMEVDSLGSLLSQGLLHDSTTVILTSGSPAALAKYVFSQRIHIPVLKDALEALARDFGVWTQPCFFFLDSSATIRWYDTGENGLSEFIRVRKQLLASDGRDIRGR